MVVAWAVTPVSRPSAPLDTEGPAGLHASGAASLGVRLAARLLPITSRP
jgi:hypothetical protein